MQTNGKKVLVTGGGSGIGLFLAKSFLDAGSKVIVCGRNLEKLEQVKQELSKIEIFQCDVTIDEQIKALLDKCKKDFNSIDILINNAGIFQIIDYKNGYVGIEKQVKEIEINLNGPIKMVHYFLPLLLKQKEAAIVNISSGLAFVPLTAAPVYCAIKAAIHSWTRSIRWQLKDTGIKVFELIPPLVDTNMVQELRGFPKMQPDELAAKFMVGFKNDKFEIAPGLAGQLKMLSKWAPGFIFKQLNKNKLK
jgi:uncharacterized oxidoreductase